MAEPKMKQYRIRTPRYSSGMYYEAGSVITVPADMKPSPTWDALESEPPLREPALKMAPAEASKPMLSDAGSKKMRVSDRDI